MLNNLGADEFTALFDGSNFIGKKIFYMDTIDSTSDEAVRIIKKDTKREFHGALVVARKQERGRGRRGAFWFSPEGMSLYTTVIIYPDSSFPLKKMTGISSDAGREIIRTLKPECKSSFYIRVKEPNDILIEGKKVAGILCESSISGEEINYIAVGLGINFVRPPVSIPEDIADKIGFLEDYLIGETDMRILYRNIILSLESIF